MADGIDLRALEQRVGALETWKHTFEAVNEERRKYMQAEFDRLNRKVDDIIGYIRTLVFIVAAAVVSGVVAFIFGGGMSLGV